MLDRSDGQFNYEDQTWGYGANLGLIYAPQPGTRIGLAYTSEINLDFDSRLDVSGTGPLLTPLMVGASSSTARCHKPQRSVSTNN